MYGILEVLDVALTWLTKHFLSLRELVIEKVLLKVLEFSLELRLFVFQLLESIIVLLFELAVDTLFKFELVWWEVG